MLETEIVEVCGVERVNHRVQRRDHVLEHAFPERNIDRLTANRGQAVIARRA